MKPGERNRGFGFGPCQTGRVVDQLMLGAKAPVDVVNEARVERLLSLQIRLDEAPDEMRQAGAESAAGGGAGRPPAVLP